MDDKASLTEIASNRGADVASVAGTAVSVAATTGTTVVGSVATESVAASDITSDQMMDIDYQTAQPPPAIVSSPVKAGESKDDKDSKQEKTEDAAESTESGSKVEEKKDKEKEKEADEEILNNPCRVLKAQQNCISFPKEIESQPVRYTPLLRGSRRVGFLLLQDNRPDEAEDLFLEDDKKDDEEAEPSPPAPFEWTDDA